MSKQFLRTHCRWVILAAVCFLAISCQSQDLAAPVATAQQDRSADHADTLTIAAVGDIMLGSTSINDSFLPPNDGRDMLKPFIPVLSAADIAFGNLEGPLIDGGTTSKCPAVKPPKPGETPKPIRCFAFRSPTRYGKYLKEAGFDVLSLANNHALDFGDDGRVSTRKVLDDLGILHAGSDRIRYSTAVAESGGRKVAFVAFAHNAIVPNVNELAAARALVVTAGKKADIVVVSFHGGAEGERAQNVPKAIEIFAGEKRGNLPLFARTVIDAGADLVLGHGPHVLRGMEIYKDRLIVYSMGNFATYGMFNLKGPQGLTAVFEINISAKDGSFQSGKIHAGKQEGRGLPAADPDGQAIRKLRALSSADFPSSSPKILDDGTFVAN